MNYKHILILLGVVFTMGLPLITIPSIITTTSYEAVADVSLMLGAVWTIIIIWTVNQIQKLWSPEFAQRVKEAREQRQK